MEKCESTLLSLQSDWLQAGLPGFDFQWWQEFFSSSQHPDADIYIYNLTVVYRFSLFEDIITGICRA
jgi:ABC-type spermidine/putrescine transport system permease subunit II